jgi:HEAT repeat protein
MGPSASRAIPALIPLLRHQHPDFRENAANALGNLGPEAIAAISELRN